MDDRRYREEIKSYDKEYLFLWGIFFIPSLFFGALGCGIWTGFCLYQHDKSLQKCYQKYKSKENEFYQITREEKNFIPKEEVQELVQFDISSDKTTSPADYDKMCRDCLFRYFELMENIEFQEKFNELHSSHLDINKLYDLIINHNKSVDYALKHSMKDSHSIDFYKIWMNQEVYKKYEIEYKEERQRRLKYEWEKRKRQSNRRKNKYFY